MSLRSREESKNGRASAARDFPLVTSRENFDTLPEAAYRARGDVLSAETAPIRPSKRRARSLYD